jgi:hypothetical protein
MKSQTILNKIKSLDDSKLKLLKLQNFCLSVMPQSPIQIQALEEIDRLRKECVL